MAFLLLCSLLMAAPSFAAELIVWGVPKDRGLMAALRLFEAEHPGWEVVTSAGSSGGMDPQKLMCGIAGGSPPDMLQQDRFSVGEWAVRDAFLPLDDYIAQSLREERWAVDAVAALASGRLGEAREALARLEARLAGRLVLERVRFGSETRLADADDRQDDVEEGQPLLVLEAMSLDGSESDAPVRPAWKASSELG